MFYNELSEKYLLGTCQGIHSVFLRYLRSYLVVSTCAFHKLPKYIVSLSETRASLHVFFLLFLFFLFFVFVVVFVAKAVIVSFVTYSDKIRNSYFQDIMCRTIIYVVIKYMKNVCKTANFQKSCRSAVAKFYLLRSPVETAENSCGNRYWIQNTNKFDTK